MMPPNPKDGRRKTGVGGAEVEALNVGGVDEAEEEEVVDEDEDEGFRESVCQQWMSGKYAAREV